MLNKSVTEVVSKQVKSSEIIDSLQKSNEFLLKESLKVRDLQNKLESATFKFQKLEKSKHDISNNVGQVRVADLEKEKLIEKINILEKYISDLKDVTKIDTISMDLEKYKDMYTKLAKEFQAYKKDKESKHYRMQLELGELRNSLKKISANIDHYDEDKKNYEQRFLDLSLKNRDLEERIKEFRERMAMLIEDSLRYLVFRDLYLKSEQQFNTMRLKYNQLELNIIAGNVTLSTDGVIWVSLDDPLFDLVRGFLSSPIETKIFDIPVRDRSRTRTEAPVYYPQRANSRTMTYSETQLDPSFVNLSQFTLKRPTYASLFEIDAKKTSYELPFTN